MSAEGKFKITTRIRQALLEKKEITDIVDNKVYPIIAPKDTEGDFIIYQRDKYSKEYTKMQIYNQTCHVFVTGVCEKYSTSQELAYQINEALEGIHADLNMDIRLLDSTEDFEDGKYIQVLLFSIE